MESYTSNTKCKCQGCEKRYLGCHSTCEDYKAFKETVKTVKKKKAKETVYITSFTNDVVFAKRLGYLNRRY